MAEPYCLAMVLCDGAHRDPGTQKVFLLGTFGTFASTKYPVSIQFCVYFAITDGNGSVNIWLRLVDARQGVLEESDDQNFVVFESEKNTVELESPLAVAEGVVLVQGTLKEPGVYHCELYANDNLLMSRRLVALKLGGDQQDEHNS